MATKRRVDGWQGFERFELDVDLHLEPELVVGNWGQTELKLSVVRTRSGGVIEVTDLRVKMPRDTVTRLLHEIRKLHERERAQIAEDMAALKVAT